MFRNYGVVFRRASICSVSIFSFCCSASFLSYSYCCLFISSKAASCSAIFACSSALAAELLPSPPPPPLPPLAAPVAPPSLSSSISSLSSLMSLSEADSLTTALFLIALTYQAYYKVPLVSSKFIEAGERAATIAVLALPPKNGFKIIVSLLSR
jgi:hypothetical protein